MVVRLVPDGTNFDFVKRFKFSSAFSIFLILISAVLLLTRGLSLGIDYAGGVVAEFSLLDKNAKPLDVDEVINKFEELGYKNPLINSIPQKNSWIIRLRTGDKSINNSDYSSYMERLEKTISKIFASNIKYNRMEYIGSQLSGKQIIMGSLSLLVALFGIYIYVLIKFDARYGLAGVLALIHDTIITLGFISLFRIEFNLSTTAAILTVIGYSINDSVVIYDRIREIIKRPLHSYSVSVFNSGKKSIIHPELINESINRTLSRTTMTSLATLISCIPLMVVCDGIVRYFTEIVFFGIIVGTYSSIFIATHVLLILPPYKNETSGPNQNSSKELEDVLYKDHQKMRLDG